MEIEIPAVTPAKAARRARAGKPDRGIFEKVPGSGIWWIRYVDAQGRYRHEKAHLGQRRRAPHQAEKRSAAREEAAGDAAPQVWPFSEIAEDALVYSRGHKKSWQDDESRMKRLVEWWGNRDAESVSTAEMERQLSDAARDEKWAPSTYNHYRAVLMMTYRERGQSVSESGEGGATPS